MSSESRLEARRSLLANAIRSLPPGASSSLASLDPETPLFKQPRQCDCCGKLIDKPSHKLQRFCSYACNGRWWMGFPEFRNKLHTEEARRKRGQARRGWLRSGHPDALKELERIANLNPMSRPECRSKVSQTLKAIGHRPPVQGGNGRGLTRPEAELLKLLPGWAPHVVRTGLRHAGYPAHYKLDLANPSRMICVEVDGSSHNALTRQEQDRRKTEFLASRGWIVLRFSNREILDWIASGTPTGSSISTTFRRLGINPSQSAGC